MQTNACDSIQFNRGQLETNTMQPAYSLYEELPVKDQSHNSFFNVNFNEQQLPDNNQFESNILDNKQPKNLFPNVISKEEPYDQKQKQFNGCDKKQHVNLIANVNFKEPSNSRQIQLDGGEKQLNTSLLTNVDCTEQPSVNIQVEPNAYNIQELDDNNRLRPVTKKQQGEPKKKHRRRKQARPMPLQEQSKKKQSTSEKDSSTANLGNKLDKPLVDVTPKSSS